MDISEDRKTDAVILALSGKLDATTAKPFIYGSRDEAITGV
jgi:hypothetical protein